MNALIVPPFLHKKDKVVIVSPSGAIDPELIDGACAKLIAWGFIPVVGAYAKGKYGRFAGTDEQRLFDLQNAIDDPSVAAILCGRGGYGAMRIVDQLDFSKFAEHPKWLIGFSDITALHARFQKEGYASIHGVMAKALAHYDDNQVSVDPLRQLLMGELPTYSLPPMPEYNRLGTAKGQLVGGNLSLLYGMQASPWGIQAKGKILFIEDLSERMYHIDRMIQSLRLAGVFKQIKGLIVGQFSQIDADPSFDKSIEEIITTAVGDRSIPIAFNFPVGHVTNNQPLIHGAQVKLKVMKGKTTLEYI